MAEAELDNGSQETSTLRVIVADDHPIVLSGIREELSKHWEIELIGEARNGDEALRMAIEMSPDVLVLDVNMPGKKASAVTEEISSGQNPPGIMVLSAYSDIEYVLALLRAGATGYMLKDENPSVIAEGIQAVAAGKTWLSAEVAGFIIDQTVRRSHERDLFELTARETQVIKLLANGLSNRQIAEILTVTEGTVKNHVSNIYQKTGANSRAQAVAWAWKHGLAS